MSLCWQAWGREASPNPGGVPGNPARAKRTVNDICLFDSTKNWALHFLANQETGKNIGGRLGDGIMSLTGAHFTANINHLKDGVSVGCERGVNNT